MPTNASRPLVVQGDRSIYLEVHHPDFREASDQLVRFAELEKSPHYVHIYRITKLSLWNAAATGMSSDAILAFLSESAKYPVPASVRDEIVDFVSRYGCVQLVSSGGRVCLRIDKPSIWDEIRETTSVLECLEVEGRSDAPGTSSSEEARELDSGEEQPILVPIRPECRGSLKIALIKRGFPVEDLAGYQDGATLAIDLRDAHGSTGEPFALRPYQRAAIDAFYDGGRVTGGSGVVTLPCGAGKTVVAIGVLERVGAQALILTTNTTALRQWKRELLDKTRLSPEEIGEYSGDQKEIRPITLTTYQMLTYRDRHTKDFLHYRLFTARQWGIIVYDEVHLLPAPVFRFTAQIQATRRLGLTATLVREDGREAEVFSLIGPRKYGVPWRSLESGGWIATASCVEIRVPFADGVDAASSELDRRRLFRLASENQAKLGVVRELIERHPGERVLIIGQYIDQLKRIQREIGAPLITGRTATGQREELYAEFRDGDLPVLIVSKVGNFAVDLPDATVAIQVSGTFGSRQEEAQRLGRILRPKAGGKGAVFYSVVTQGTSEQEFAEKRQRFLTEQGYRYAIEERESRRSTSDPRPCAGDSAAATNGSRPSRVAITPRVADDSVAAGSAVDERMRAEVRYGAFVQQAAKRAP